MGSACVYNKRVLTKFTHEKDWTSNASGNRHTHRLAQIQHLSKCWFWRVHICEITRQPNCWDCPRRGHRFEFMRLGHTHHEIKIERNPWRVHLRMSHLSKGFHLVRWRSEHPIFWRVSDRKMSKLIKTFCNNALTPWAFFLISKHVLRRVKRHDLGRVRKGRARILWRASRGGGSNRGTLKWWGLPGIGIHMQQLTLFQFVKNLKGWQFCQPFFCIMEG